MDAFVKENLGMPAGAGDGSGEEVVSMGVLNTVMNLSEKGVVKGFSAQRLEAFPRTRAGHKSANEILENLNFWGGECHREPHP